MNSTSGFAVLIQILSSLSLDAVPSDALPVPLSASFLRIVVFGANLGTKGGIYTW